MPTYTIYIEGISAGGTFMLGSQREVQLPQPRFADLILACCLIVLCLPLMTLVAIAIKCDSRGPVLIWEQRIRPSGRQFWALKFRCAVHRARVTPDAEPEVTLVGGIIRHLRIDTLPQLVNILRGEMTCLPADPDYQFFLE
jgi:lipopolysaccharide/colanic/teichoic acid biosynthesis glycosyltransferase